MKITTITYRRVANLGSYESCHVEVTGELGDGDKKGDCILKLKKFVDEMIDFEVKEHSKIKRSDYGARL